MTDTAETTSVEPTQSQQAAIRHGDGPMLIIAGPGSGKTEVMTRRVARLIHVHHINPEHILCITFTNKAADQLKDKIQYLVDTEIDQMQISTIHSLCHTLLERYVSRIQVRYPFRVLDENSQFLYVYNRRYQLKLNFPKSRKGQFLRQLIQFFNQCTEEMIDPEELIAAYQKWIEQCEDENQRPYYEELLGVAESYWRYCTYLLKDSLLDYGHLQKLAYQLLQEHSDVLKDVREQYQYIQVDEFQDTNPIQAQLFRLIAGERANITVVGDDDQSIYRFRGATVENIHQFRKWYPNTRTVKLQSNFRSTKGIVDFTSRFIKRLDNRFEKQLTTKNEKGNTILHVHGADVRDQAEKTAALLKDLKKQNYVNHYGDVALFLRSVSHHGQEYLEAFRKHGIPFIVEGDRSLFKREDVNGFRNLLLFLGDKKVNLSQLNETVLGFDIATREILSGLSLTITDQGPGDVKLPHISHISDREKIQKLLNLRKTVQDKKYDDVTSVFFTLMEISGYFEWALERNDEEVLKNLGFFSSVIFRFDEIANRTSVDQFEWYLRWLGTDALDQATPEVRDAVQIMTVHQAKGLEFPAVIIGSLLEGRFPVRYRSTYYKIPTKLKTFESTINEDIHLDDERRLFYVASTRAEKLLILSSAEKVNQRGQVSRFLKECPANRMQVVDSALPSLSRFTVHRKSVGERIYLSYSHIMYYLYCPLRYQFFAEYDFHVPQIVRVAYGASLHLALAELHRKVCDGEFPEESELEQIYNENWIPMGSRARRFEESLKVQGLKLFVDYYRKNQENMGNVYAVEWPFTCTREPVVLQGRVDLMRESDDGLEIIDFKTGGLPGKYGVDPKLQLGIYALAVEKNLVRPINHVTFYSLKENKAASFPWNEELQDCTEREISRAAAGIGRRNFHPTPGKHCADCEFNSICIHSLA